MIRNRLLLTPALVSLAACGGGGDGGTTPPPPGRHAKTVTVSISSSDVMASLGDTRALTAVVKDSSDAVMTGATVKWATTAPAVLVLTPPTGLASTATGVGNGNATITATSGTATGSVATTVQQRLASVQLTPGTFSLTVGGVRLVTAAARDARSNAIAGVSGFEFSSNLSGVASVSSIGNVTAHAPGTATITGSLTHDAVTASGTATVTVTAGPAPTTATVTTGNSSFNPASVEITPGGTVTWNFGATAHNVNFSSSAAPDGIPTTSNASVSRTFPTAGTFAYECRLHEAMTGTVIVR